MRAVHCGNCGGDDSELLFTKWDHRIVQCRHCWLVYVNPQAFHVEDDSYFQSAYLETIEDKGLLRAGIEYLYSQVLLHLGTHLYPGRLLDVGCAMGHFLRFAQQRGWNVHGVECSAYASRYGRERWGLPIQTACDLSSARLPEQHFDACVMIEVAEHLPDPKGTISTAFRLLKPGGVLYLTVPNFGSFRSLLQREEWPAVIPTGHLTYFTFETLSQILFAAGFESPVNLTPPADLDGEIAALRRANHLRLSDDQIQDIRARTTEFDRSRFSNGRGEGLVVWAVKPVPSSLGQVASLRSTLPMPRLEEMLITAPPAAARDGKVYLVRDGLKHWVTDAQWLTQNGLRLEQTIQVDADVLDRILPGWPLTV